MKNNLKKTDRFKLILISFVVSVIGVCIYFSGILILDLFELKTIDLRFLARGKITANADIVLAVIDEKSLDIEGRWPWPRKKIGILIKNLIDSGAKVIALDIFCPEPDNQNPENDEFLVNLMREYNTKIVTSYFFHMNSDSLAHISQKEIIDREKQIIHSTFTKIYVHGEEKRTDTHVAKIPEPNFRRLSSNTKFSGFVNNFPDRDGCSRMAPAIIKFNENLYPHLALTTASAFLNKPLSIKTAKFGIEGINIGDLFVPTNEFGEIYINWRGGFDIFPHVSATDIINKKVSEKTFKDKVVILGTTATGTHDFQSTPFGILPGIAIHANILDSIISGDFLIKPNWSRIFDVASIFIGGLFLGIILSFTRSISGFIFFLCFTSAFILFGYFLFVSKGFILNMFYPVSVFIFIYLLTTTSARWFEGN